MRPFSRVSLVSILVLLVASLAATKNSMPNLQAFKNSTGVHRTFSKAGSIDLSNAFFQPLGTNGRSCVTCHAAEDAWSITPDHLQQRFNVDGGLDPVFRPVDGANCPSADVSTADARRSAYSMLLKKGVIRVSLPIPAAAEFTVVAIDDPYSCAETTKDNLAFFRRPLPAANLPFLTTVMWDGRESFAANTLAQNLSHQAMDATLGHAQGAASPTAQQLKEIVDFETQLYTAQTDSAEAGELNGQGGNGGPAALGSQKFYLGINDALGGDPTGGWLLFLYLK
jgi:cytochrome c peroxidase